MSKKRDAARGEALPRAPRPDWDRKAEVDGGAEAAAHAEGVAETDGSLGETGVESDVPRLRSCVRLVLAHDATRAALTAGSAVELRSSDDESSGALFPHATRVDVDPGNAAAALATVMNVADGLKALIVFDLLQSVVETRQFLGACFSRLAVGGTMIIVAPHQFLYERKLKVPSRRTDGHRRFYTSNTLLADLEEAIDAREFRIRRLCENDAGYDYGLGLDADPDGGQDIVVILEKIARPPWSAELAQEELWAHPRRKPTRLVEVKPDAPQPTRVIAPDPREVRRIVILKLDHRGDYLLAEEAFKIFRNAFPAAEITLVCGSWNVAAAEQSGYFDEIVALDFFAEDGSARAKTPPREIILADFAGAIAGRTYDLAVDLRLFDDTREVLQTIDARVRAGFDRHDTFPWLAIRLNTPSATEDDRAEQLVVVANDFRANVGAHRSFEIRLEENRPEEIKPAIFGPYKDLRAGRYSIECLMEPLSEDFEVAYDIAGDRGQQILQKGTIAVRAKRYPTVQLNLPEPVGAFEFRIRSVGGGLRPFRFLGLRLVRAGAARGVHQSEAMALLAHLVGLRMVDAYTVELLDAAV